MSTPTSSTLNGTNTRGQTRPLTPIQDNPQAIAAEAPARFAPARPASGPVPDNCNPGTIGNVRAVATDFKTLAGSYAGDHRNRPGDVVKRSMDEIANRKGIREPMGGQQNSKHSNENHPTYTSTVGTEEHGD